MDLKELASGVDPASHWYYRTKRLPVLSCLRALLARRPGPLDIVDVGAGSGFFAESVIDAAGGRVRDAILVDAGYADEGSSADPRVSGRVWRRREPPRRIGDSLILMMDVLEHVPDDAGFLRSTVARCDGRNHFFLTAPAFKGLWSSHDDYLGHLRRYTLPQLEAVAVTAGLRVTSGYYLYGALLPAVWAVRRWGPRAKRGDLRPTSPAVSRMLELICRVEFAFRRLNRLGGVTCVVEAVLDP